MASAAGGPGRPSWTGPRVGSHDPAGNGGARRMVVALGSLPGGTESGLPILSVASVTPFCCGAPTSVFAFFSRRADRGLSPRR